MGGNQEADSAGFSSHLAKAVAAGDFPPAVAVFPNGGRSGYRGEVEKMILDELILTVEKQYRVLAGGANRVVLGFSMDGAGSVRLSLRRPDAFAAAATMGGGFWAEDPDATAAVDAKLPKLAERGWGLFAVNGDRDRPDAFRDLAERLKTVGIGFASLALPDTGHDLGRYHELGLPSALKFLTARLPKG